MAHPKVAVEFDQIIQADRNRKRNEELASQIFGRNKQKEKEANKKDPRRTSRPPSLASRIGITKRSSSTSSNSASRPQLSRPPSNTVQQTSRQNRIAAELSNSASTNIVPTNKTAQNPRSTGNLNNGNTGPGISIKGSAAPFVVEARNFAAGTSAADIESAIERDCFDASGINALVSCKVVTQTPTVSVELVFNERSVADSIIRKYHNQRADGNTLELEIVRSGPGSMSKHHQNKKQQTGRLTSPVTVAANHDTNVAIDDAEMGDDIDMEPEPVTQQTQASKAVDSYEEEREAAARDRRDRESRRERDDYDSSSGGRRRDDDRRRDDRDRERERERERERDRPYDSRDRDDGRNYARREEGRGGRGSHYGNGVGGQPSAPISTGPATGPATGPSHSTSQGTNVSSQTQPNAPRQTNYTPGPSRGRGGYSNYGGSSGGSYGGRYRGY